MQLCRQNTLLAAKGGCICTPLTPPKSATVFIRWTETLQVLELGWALIRFIGSIRVRLGLMRLGLGISGLRQTRVRARARLRVLRWRGSLSAEVNENKSQDQGYS